MMKTVILISFVLISTISAARLRNYLSPSTTQCGTSRDCNEGYCCRNGTRLVDPSGWQNMWGEPFEGLGGSTNRGTCSSQMGREGEVCSQGCACGKGLRCYRPMTGVCCPPSTCKPEEYVKKMEEYWRNCHTNPRCFFPVKK